MFAISFLNPKVFFCQLISWSRPTKAHLDWFLRLSIEEKFHSGFFDLFSTAFNFSFCFFDTEPRLKNLHPLGISNIFRRRKSHQKSLNCRIKHEVQVQGALKNILYREINTTYFTREVLQHSSEWWISMDFQCTKLKGSFHLNSHSPNWMNTWYHSPSDYSSNSPGHFDVRRWRKT